MPIYQDGYRFVDSNGVVFDIRDCATQWGYGEDGKRIPGTETLHEDKAFTINLSVE